MHVCLAYLAVASLTLTLAAGSAKSAPQAMVSDVSAVVPQGGEAAAVVEAFHAAIKAGAKTEAARLLADDVLIFEAGHAEHSKAAYLAEHFPADVAASRTIQETLLRRKGASDGSLAWVVSEGAAVSTGSGGGGRLTTETMILRQSIAGWRIVHIHWSSRKSSPPQ